MAAPVAMILGALAKEAGAAASGFVQRGIQVASDPLIELVNQWAWHKFPYHLPGGDMILQTIIKGYSRNNAQAWDALRFLGYDFNDNTFYGKLWHDCKELLYAKPGIAEIMNGRATGFCTQETAERLLKENGAKFDDWFWVANLLESRLDQDQLLQAYLRGYIDEQQYNIYMRHHGFTDPSKITKIRQLGMQLPGPSDIIRFSVREAFNEDQVQKLGLDEEYDQQGDFRDIARAVGVGEVEIKTPDGKKIKVDVPKLYWRAHWELPSPGQVYEMLKRLRPDRIKHVRAQFKDVQELKLEPVTMQDVRNLLKAADYSPTWRDRLAAISYNVVTRVDARRMFETKVIDRDELKAIYQDQGYSAIDAENLTKFSETEITLKELNKTKRISKSAVIESYSLGAIDKPTAAARLYELTLTTVKDWEEWLAVPEANKGNFALAKGTIRGDLETVELKLRINRFRTELAAIKYRFLNGLDSPNVARANLQLLGVIPERQSYYLGIWTALRDGPRKTLTMQNLMGLHLEGVIGDFDLRDRLLNLGYSQRETGDVVRLAGIKFRRRVETAIARELKERQKEQERLLKEIEKKTKAKGKKTAPVPPGPTVAMVQRWLKEGLFSESDAVTRLKELGWKQEYIDDVIAEATSPA